MFETDVPTYRQALEDLMALASGDEKHDLSAY